MTKKIDSTGITNSAVLDTAACSADPVNMPRKLAYRKSLAASLPLGHADASWVTGTIGGSLYPQSFAVQESTDEIFVLTNAPQVVSVFQLSTGQYLTCFALNNGTFTSEGIVIRQEGSSRILYTRGASNFIRGYDITTLPAPRSTLTAASTSSVTCGRNFSFRNGVWMLGDETPEVGFIRARNKYIFRDASFNWVGQTRVSPLVAGITESAPFTGITPKTQGCALTDTGFILSLGGFQRKTDPFSLYGLNGLLAFGPDGTAEFSALMDPLRMITFIGDNIVSLTAIDRVENEGVCVTDEGNIFTMCVINASLTRPVSLLVFREFSDDSNALDFSSCAMNWAVPAPPTAEAGIFPRFGSAARNPFTGAAFANWGEIVDYMRASGQSVFRYYTSNDPSILDINGDAVPGGWFVTFESANNSTMSATMVRPFSAGVPTMLYSISGNVDPKIQVLRRGQQVLTSVSAKPDHIGQAAVVSGVGYMAVGTSSTADWKRVTA